MTVKTIVLHGESYGDWMSYENWSKKFPNFEKLPFNDIKDHYEYIKHLNKEPSKLKYLPQFTLATTVSQPAVVADRVEKLRRILQGCPALEEMTLEYLKFTRVHLVDLIANSANLKKLRLVRNGHKKSLHGQWKYAAPDTKLVPS